MALAELIPPTSKEEHPDPLLRVYDLPCDLVLEVEADSFTVATLLELAPGKVICTATPHNEELLLRVHGQVVGTVEVDVIGNRLAARLTGLA